MQNLNIVGPNCRCIAVGRPLFADPAQGHSRYGGGRPAADTEGRFWCRACGAGFDGEAPPARCAKCGGSAFEAVSGVSGTGRPAHRAHYRKAGQKAQRD